MAEIFDFNKFKEMRKISNDLEEEYLNFLPWINNKLGVPTDLASIIKVLFIVIRYLEGTVNGFSILANITSIDRKNVEEGKKVIIDWLEEIIQTIKDI